MYGQLSRPALGSMMGLTRAGLSKVVDPLLKSGIVQPVGNGEGRKSKGRGRPPQILTIGNGVLYGLGIAVDYHIDLVLLDFAHRVVAEKRLPNRFQDPNESEDAFVRELVRECQKMVTRAEKGRLVGAGVAFSGDLTEDGSWVSRGNDFASVKQANQLIGELRKAIPCPVHLVNDTCACALVERWLAEDLPLNPTLAFVTNRLGIALIIEGRLYHGPTTWSRWLGHVQVDPNGALCSCGRKGCLAITAAPGGLTDQLAGYAFGTRPPLPAGAHDAEIETMLTRYRKGDSHVVAMMQRAFDDLGRALRNLATIFAFDAIVLDSWAGEHAEEGLKRVRNMLSEGKPDLTRQYRPPAVVRLPTLGERDEVIGAVLYAIDQSVESQTTARPHVRKAVLSARSG